MKNILDSKDLKFEKAITNFIEKHDSVEVSEIINQIQGGSYLSKRFLVESSFKSMAAIQCKIKSNLEYSVRISDCNKTIKLWGNLKDQTDRKEFEEKIETVISELSKFKEIIQKQFPL
jgi:hypothetical protein